MQIRHLGGALLLIFTSASFSNAQEYRSEWALRDRAKISDEKINAGSDASFDKRLPPVLPGEEVNDSGHRMKVWSTSGSVPVSEAPDINTRSRSAHDIDHVEIAIDGRDRLPKSVMGQQDTTVNKK